VLRRKPSPRAPVFGRALAAATLFAVPMSLPAAANDPAATAPGEPRPIPGLTGAATESPAGLHFFPPGFDPVDKTFYEPSTITDFEGSVAVAQITGSGVGTDTRTGLTYPMDFDIDMRIMEGRYRGADGEIHRGSFGFI
jgi:hypothetical protein